MERNFETVMIEQCAPVLASLKPAGLFRYETRDCADLARRVKNWNEQLQPKGLRVRVLKGLRTHPPVSRLCVPREHAARGADRRDRAGLSPAGGLPSAGRTGRLHGPAHSSFHADCAARPNSRMRSAFFWATPERCSGLY